MPGTSKSNLLQRILIIASGLVFLGLMVIPLLESFGKKPNPTAANPAAGQNPEEQKQLLALAQGYEQVLKREPNNLTALQGLAGANIKLRNFEGALPPLEKLNQLSPNTPQIMPYLAEIRVQTGDKSGGIALLEAFVKKYPDIPEAQKRLKELKQSPGK
jgi:cytochrome c-type biogenesis protein CcmH/NrfG